MKRFVLVAAIEIAGILVLGLAVAALYDWRHGNPILSPAEGMGAIDYAAILVVCAICGIAILKVPTWASRKLPNGRIKTFLLRDR